MFRSGNEDAFRAIHDRYRPRMLAYTRQMLSGSPQDPEDAVQEVFVRAYSGLRASRRELALRAWLYRIAHNRCVDELRRPHHQVVDAVDALVAATHDPVAKVEQRDSLRRLIADVQRLPDQQRSALLMRELSGMAYADVAGALGVSVPAVKSLLVRARVGLAQASEARDTACAEIRADLISSHDRGVRTSGLARRHMRDCPTCRAFRSDVRGVSRQFAALVPTLGPIGVIAHLLGWGGGGGAAAGSSAAAGGGAAVGGGAVAAGTGAAVAGTGAASAGLLAGGAGHVVTLLAAALVATGGAVEIQHSLGHVAHHQRSHVAPAAHQPATEAAPIQSIVPTAPMIGPAPPPRSATPSPARSRTSLPPHHTTTPSRTAGGSSGTGTSTAGAASASRMPITMTLDPDSMMSPPPPTDSTTATTAGTGSTPTGTGTGATTTGTGTGSTGTGTPTGGTGTGDTGTGTGTPTGGTGTGGSTGSSGGSGGSGTATAAVKLTSFGALRK